MIHSFFKRLFSFEASGANITDNDFPALFGLIGGCLHQDMDIEYDTVPEAFAAYARFTETTEKQMLFTEMDSFLKRYGNDLEGEFARRFGFDFTPDVIGQTVPEFFDMVRTIFADPKSHLRFEPDT